PRRNDKRIARGLARGYRGQEEPLGRLGRHVLERVHRAVSATVQHRAVDFLREQPGTADVCQGYVGDPVAGRRYDVDLDPEIRLYLAQQRRYVASLPECERTAARGESLHVLPPCTACRASSGTPGTPASTRRANAGLSSGGARKVVKITMIRIAP